MAIDFTKPATTDNYSTAFVPNIQGNQTALAQLLDSSLVTITGTPPTGVKRYNATSTGLEQYNGSAWVGIPLQGITLNGANVGMGTASAAAKLHVDGTGGIFSQASYPYATISQLASSTDVVLGGGVIADVTGGQLKKLVPDIGNFIRMQLSDGIAFHTGIGGAAGSTFARTLNERVRIDLTGLTTFQKSAANAEKLRLIDSNAFLTFYNDAGTTRSFMLQALAGGDVIYAADGTTAHSWTQSGVEGMRLASGKLSLGVASSAAWLHIKRAGGLTFATVPQFAVQDTGASQNRFAIGVSNTGVNFIAGGSTANPYFAWLNNDGSVEHMRLDNSGNLLPGVTGTQNAGSASLVWAKLFGSELQAPGAGGLLLNASNAAGSVNVAVNGATRGTFDSLGQLGLGLTPATSGNNRGLLQLVGSANGGIYLGNTANAATNVLDWYEEGTFTPTIAGGTTAGTASYSQAIGTFTRVGNQVSFCIKLSYGAFTGTGATNINGLPYAGQNNNLSWAFPVDHSGLTYSGQLVASLNATTLNLRTVASGGSSTAFTLPSAAGPIYISGTYLV